MISLVFYSDEDGKAPFVDWFGDLPDKAQDNCRVRLERLRELGHLLRRPEAAPLRDGIYELRVKAERVQYRMLYFFHGEKAVVISHGIVKQRADVPPIEIARAIEHKQAFELNPARHTYSLKAPL